MNTDKLKTLYSREYSDNDNIFVSESSETLTDSDDELAPVPLDAELREDIINEAISFSETYRISLTVKESDKLLLVAFGFGKFMYLNMLKPLILISEDVFIVHEEDMTMIELIFCIK